MNMNKKVIKSYYVDLSSLDDSTRKRKTLSDLKNKINDLQDKINEYEINKINLEHTIFSNIIEINNLQENNNELLKQNKILYDNTLLSGNINTITDLFN